MLEFKYVKDNDLVTLVYNQYLKDALIESEKLKEGTKGTLNELYIIALGDEVKRLQKIIDNNKIEVPLSSSKVPSNETFDVIKQHIKALSDLLPIDDKADDEADDMMQEAREKVSLGTRKIDRNDKDYFYDGLVGVLRDDLKIYWADKGFIDKCLQQLELIIIELSKKNNLSEITKYFKFSYCRVGGCYFYYHNTEKSSFATFQCFELGGISFSSNRWNESYSFKLTSSDNITDAVENLSEWFKGEK